jgi:hypothetical protein
VDEPTRRVPDVERASLGNGWVITGALAVSLVCLGASAYLQRGRLSALRKEHQLGFTENVVENLPPEIAFTQVALGSFRGLAVDVLWIRAWELKREGRYYELMQISDWITKLQPRFVEVWKSQSHNLAYNLSEAVFSPEEKWMWVKAGLKLLQDQGIPLNPEATDLYQQLSWTYYHRVGKYSTETHWYFKVRHALEWHRMLGAPPQGETEEVLAWFRPVAEAPERLAQVLTAHPDAGEKIAALRKMGFDLDRAWLETAVQLREMREEAMEIGGTVASEQEALARVGEMMALLDTPTGAALLAYVRAKTIRDDYRMEPALMQDLVREYGALDWRHPHAHALYWAVRGARETMGRKSTDLYNIVQTDRMVIHSLQGLAYAGRIQFDSRTGYYNATPDPRIFDAFEKAAAEAARRQNVEGATPWELEEVHRGFMMWATQALYLYSTRERSLQYYRHLQDVYSAKWPGLYTKPLDDFVLDQILQGRKIIEQAQVIITGLAFNAFNQGLVNSDPEYSKRLLAQARIVFEKFKATQRVNSPDVKQQQKELPPFGLMVMDAFANFLMQPSDVLPIRFKKRAWDSVDSKFLLPIYDRVRPRLLEEAKRAGYAQPENVFPEPPGMKEYREARQKRIEENEKNEDPLGK